MTEREWLACEDPRKLLAEAPGRADPRKLRLLACACGRRAWDLLADDRSRRAVEVAEAFADGAAGRSELVAAKKGADAAYRRARRQRDLLAHRHLLAAILAAEAVALRMRFDPYATELLRGAQDRKEGAERAARARLVKDIFGNPLRPVSVHPSWLTSTVCTLAAGIYAERAFDRLPILADALQDAGCEHDDMLAHCRGPGPHVRGCWALDLILGKT